MSGVSPRKNINRHMTTHNQPPRPDWSQVDLPEAHSQDLQRLYGIETRYRMSAALGSAIIGYLCKGDAPDPVVEYLELCWESFFVDHAFRGA